jgi:CheY-like chemotaxis protein
LQRWKVDFAFADNGKIALDKLKEAEFDLVLMDLQMPEMDGYEATLQIRSGKSGVLQTGIPIIAISADAFSQTREKALSTGMNAFVSKPIDMGALYDAITRNLRNNKNIKHKNQNTMEDESPDLSYLLNLSGNNRDFVKEILQLTLKEMPKDAEQLRLQSEAADWPSASKVAHKMKSSVANLGLQHLKEILLDIEKMGKEGRETEKIPVMVNEVLNRLQAVYTYLEDYISK